MASFAQNLRKIRGEAVYGQDMRTAIADAIEQAIHFDVTGEDSAVVEVERISQETDDYLVTIINAS